MFEPRYEKMSREEIRRLQNRRLKKMVRYAYERVPMYRKRWDEAGVRPEDVRCVEDLPGLPFTVKTDLRDHYPYGILAVKLEEVNRFHASSGTTGKPTVVSYTPNDLRTWWRLMARSMACGGVTPKDLVQNAYGYGLFTGGLGFHYGAETLGAAVLPTSTGNTKKQLMLLRDLKATVLCCTPSYATYLAEAAKAEGYDPKKDFRLRLGLFGAEPWSEEARDRIQKALGLRAVDNYGMSELYGPGVAVECRRQNGLHVWEDEFVLEVIDPLTGDPAPPGVEGEMVFTMLTREAMPLIRYRTRDLAVVERKKCKCGRNHARIMRITGRSDDMLIVGGVNVFPSQIEDVLFAIPGVGDQYLIIIDRDILDSLTIQVEMDPKAVGRKGFDRGALLRRISSDLQASLTVRAKVELLDPGALPRTEGKAQRVKDLRKKA